jgi:outer membrane receptor protein involved in Fe transport
MSHRFAAAIIIALLAAGTEFAQAGALDTPVAVSIPASSLGDALRALARQSSLQILFDSALVAGHSVPETHESASPRATLDDWLKATGLEAVEQAPGVIVIRAREIPTPAPDKARTVRPAVPAVFPAADDGGAEIQEITVTARKKDESAINVPVSITAFTQADLERLDISSFTDYATKTPNMTFSYGTANYGYVDSHTIAIRGISGLGTTGFYIDDTPVPDSLDPRVVDIARIEILKGPQGTLFGQSSLGGNLRLITVEPTPGADAAHYTAKVGDTSGAGSPDYGIDFAGSHTLIDDTLVARVVGFYDHAGGFMHREVADPNTGAMLGNYGNYGAEESYGGSLALRWLVNDWFDGLFRIMAQQSNSTGWSAPYAPLPGFSIQSLTMNRTNDIPEQARDGYYLPSMLLKFKGSGYSVTESLSYFDRYASQLEDGSEGSRDSLVADWAGAASVANPNAYPYAGITGMFAQNTPWAWVEDVSGRRTTSETRLSFDKTSFGLSGVTGVYLSRSYSNTYINSGSSPLIKQLGLNTDQGSTNVNNYFYGNTTPQSYCRSFVGDTSCATYGTGLGWESTAPSYHKDAALFGELYYEFANFELTAGGRYYHQTQTGNEFEAGAFNFSQLNIVLPETRQDGFDPKLALKYNFNPSAMVYASYSKGFRAGGAGVPLPTGPLSFFAAIGQRPNAATTYTSDFVQNFEIGGKVAFDDGKIEMSGALFQMNWSNIQQSIIAPVTAIALTVNAGDARVRGGEYEINAKPVRWLDLHAGVGYEDAVITRGVLYWQPTGSAVYNTPKITANASTTFTVPLSNALSSFYTVDGSYVGSSYSGTAGCQLNVGPNGLPQDYPASTYPNGYQFFPCPSVSSTDLQGYAPKRAGYFTLNARTGLTWGRSELGLYANNLTNARPNLGDFSPSSYPAIDAATGYLIPRVATLRPLNLGLQFRQWF